MDEIWHSYSSKQDTKQSRTNFSDDVNFIGWYANRLHKVSNVPIQNAYDLYMAYHDGGGGYRYDKKHKYNPTKKIAAHVQYISNLYKIQLESC